MPAPLTYPGIYIEEIPSGVRTITGVATSITAFIGRTQRGPVNEPTTIHSFADFERFFGGLWYESTVSYAVRDFYLNGGQEAIIVRLFNPLFEKESDRKNAEDATRTAALDAAQRVVTAATNAAKLGASGEDVAKMAEAAVVASPEAARDASEAVAKAARQAVTSPSSVAEAAESAAKEAGKTSIDAYQAANEVANVARGAVNTNATAESVAKAASDSRDSLNKKANDDLAAVKAKPNAPPAEVNDAENKATQIKSATNAVANKANDAVHTAKNVALAAANAVNDAVSAVAAGAAPRSFAEVSLGDLILQAANAGSWGNHLRARVDYDGIEAGYGLQKDDLFNLTVRDMKTGAIERFLNVTTKIQPDTSRRLDKVLENESSLVRVPDNLLPVNRPEESDKQLTEDAELANEPNATNAEKTKAEIAKKALKVPPFFSLDETRSVGVLTAGMASDGNYLQPDDFTESGDKKGLNTLEKADLFNLLCIPPLDRDNMNTPAEIYQKALQYCYDRRAMLLVDPPKEWSSNKDTAASDAKEGLDSLGLSGTYARNAAIYFPRVLQTEPLRERQIKSFVPCGIMAGIIARTDSQRGVWKAPAGIDASLNGIVGLDVNLTDAENGTLNPLGINCLRSFRVYGNVVWGARTMRGADQMADEYKYIPVRRVALFIEESLYRGLKWVVFEPNDEPLWAQIRLNVGAFMHSLFRQGAFQGKTPQEAYFVKCDKDTTTQDDINRGIVNIMVGFAPLKPAEFVVIKLQQMAGQIQT
jgi:uncharacterized protein